MIKGSTVFDQTFVKSLRVRNILWAGFCLFFRSKAQQKGVTVFGCETAPKAMRGASGASAKMDGVIVAVAHDEFRGMGLSGVSGVLGAGAVVVDVRGVFEGGVVEGKGFWQGF